VYAGKAGGGEQLRETALGVGGLDGRTVQNELRTGGAEEQTGFVTGRDGGAKLGPGVLELFGGAGVIESVKADELQ
jgi:hypothetical protein